MQPKHPQLHAPELPQQLDSKRSQAFARLDPAPAAMPAMDGSSAGGTVFVTVGTTKFDALIRAVDQQVRGCCIPGGAACATVLQPRCLYPCYAAANASSWRTCNGSYLPVCAFAVSTLRSASPPMPCLQAFADVLVAKGYTRLVMQIGRCVRLKMACWPAGCSLGRPLQLSMHEATPLPGC